jgi:predicted permease
MSVFTSLALAALQAIIQVAVICLFGHILARKGYLSQPLQKGLSILSVKFFTPCLLFANTAASVTWDNFTQLWPLPVYFLLFSGAAWLLAKAAVRPLQLTVAQTRFVTATLMFSNTNSLPIGLIESLTMSGAVAWLRWHEDDKNSLIAARGIAYIVFYSILGNVVRWSYGAYLLGNDLDAPEDMVVSSASTTTLAVTRMDSNRSTIYNSYGKSMRNKSSDTLAENSHPSGNDQISLHVTLHNEGPNSGDESDVDERQHLLPPQQTIRSLPTPRPGNAKGSEFETDKLLLVLSEESAMEETDSEPPQANHAASAATGQRSTASSFWGFNSEAVTPINSDMEGDAPHTTDHSANPSAFRRVRRQPLRSRGAWQGSDSDSLYEAHGIRSESHCLLGGGGASSRATGIRRTLRRSVRRIRHAFKPVYHYLKPVLTAPFLAALLGLMVALSPLRSILIESDGALHTTLFAAVRTCGEAAVPVILVCLGAQLTTLAQHQPTGPGDSMEAGTPRSLPPGYPSYRHVIPFIIVGRLIILPAIALAIVWFTLPFAGGLKEDPMFFFTVLLVGACPTAINLMTVCQANGHFEHPMGRVLMWEYLLSACSMVCWCVAFLWMAKKN